MTKYDEMLASAGPLFCLFYAISDDDAELALAALGAGADPLGEPIQGKGHAAWFTAAEEGAVRVIAALLDARPDLLGAKERAFADWTALHHAAHRAQDKAVSLLVGSGADASARNRHGGTPAQVANSGVQGKDWFERCEATLAILEAAGGGRG